MGRVRTTTQVIQDWPVRVKVATVSEMDQRGRRFRPRALEYERPFLSPLCRFLTLHPRGSVRKLPSYVIFTLKYLAAQVQENRHYDRSGTLTTVALAPSVDAQASDTRAGVGGLCPEMCVDGTPDPSKSRWFSVEVTRGDFPYVFFKGDKAPRVIATLESLAVLIELKAFYTSVHCQKTLEDSIAADLDR